LGIEAGLANRTGGWIVSKRENPESFVDGFFDNWPPCPPPYDMIYPQPGQFANYSLVFYFPNGTVGSSGWWSFSYCEYVQPHIINTTYVNSEPPPGNPEVTWFTINTTNRWVTDASPDSGWDQKWYYLWIETPVTVGSSINWYYETSTIVGDQVLYAVGRHLDCWVANTTYDLPYILLSYYDKLSGLLVAFQVIYPSGRGVAELTLDATNIPLGVASLPFRLTKTVEGWSLPEGTENSLTSKLEAAYHLLNLDNRYAALQHLTAFVKKVEALREKKLTNEQTDHLTARAQRIIKLIKE